MFRRIAFWINSTIGSWLMAVLFLFVAAVLIMEIFT